MNRNQTTYPNEAYKAEFNLNRAPVYADLSDCQPVPAKKAKGGFDTLANICAFMAVGAAIFLVATLVIGFKSPSEEMRRENTELKESLAETEATLGATQGQLSQQQAEKDAYCNGGE